MVELELDLGMLATMIVSTTKAVLYFHFSLAYGSGGRKLATVDFIWESGKSTVVGVKRFHIMLASFKAAVKGDFFSKIVFGPYRTGNHRLSPITFRIIISML